VFTLQDHTHFEKSGSSTVLNFSLKCYVIAVREPPPLALYERTSPNKIAMNNILTTIFCQKRSFELRIDLVTPRLSSLANRFLLGRIDTHLIVNNCRNSKWRG